MKTKLSLLGATLTAVSLNLILSGTAVAQGYGAQKGSATSAATPAGATAANPNAPKPGTVLPSGVIVAMPISKEEAMKKYPPPKGGYPSGTREPHEQSGLVHSPYSPHK